VLHPKKVGSLPVEGSDEMKRTNEIKTIIPLLDQLDDIKDKTITVDALLTQRELASYLTHRGAYYHFTVKGNQKTMLEDVVACFEQRGNPDFSEEIKLAHGRIEQRKIWVSTALNDYLDFPDVAQVFVVERHVLHKRSGKQSVENAYGITSAPTKLAAPAKVLSTNRRHWGIENSCHYVIDWNFNEDRSRIRTGNGPENITRIRRFAVGLLKSKGVTNIAQKMRDLAMSARAVLDYLRMTKNTQPRTT